MTTPDWAPASAAAVPPATLSLEGYSGLTEVARGGDSIVYRARQTRLDRDVAIKVVDITEPAAQSRFARELEITVRLGRQHPHIVTVLDTTTTPDGRPCLVMDFHDLGSLHDRLRAHGPLPVSEVVAAGTAVADALAFAHAHGVLHRDVKPQNVLLLPTSYVLSDFGIARMVDAGRTASLERFSYRHASPQVLDGAEPTEADDVWSLGSTLVTLVDGRAPFASDDPDDDSALAYLRRVRTGERRQPHAGIPAELREIIETCLVPEREKRTTSAAEVIAALRRVPTEERSWAPAAPVVPDAPAAQPAAPVVPSPDAASEPQPAAPSPGAAPLAQPVAPAAIAPSALAQIEPMVDVDSAHTSAAPAHEEAASAPDTTPPPAGSPWTKIAAFIGGALVIGTGFGVLSAVLGEDDPPPTPATADPAEVPALTGELPSQSGPVQASTTNLDLAPRNPVATHQGTSVLLTWAPPVEEIDRLAITSLDASGEPERVWELAGTAEEYTVEGIDPDAAEVCFAVVGYAMNDDGSPEAGATEAFCASPS